VILSPDTRLIPREQVSVQSVENGAVLVNMGTGRCFELNRVGFEIWALLCEGASAASIGEVLSQRYAVVLSVLTADVLALLHALLQQELIELDPRGHLP
jgi:hypothetical protein